MIIVQEYTKKLKGKNYNKINRLSVEPYKQYTVSQSHQQHQPC